MKIKKQILGIKGKVWVDASYYNPTDTKKYKRIIRIKTNSASLLIKDYMSLRRGITNAILQGILLSVKKYGLKSGAMLYKLYDYGIIYDNDKVTTKTYNVKGKRYTNIYIKGRRGIIKKIKYKKDMLIDKKAINNIIKDENLTINDF